MGRDNSTSNEFVFNVLIVGDTNTGKTALLRRLCENTWSDYHTTTIGIGRRCKLLRVDNSNVKLNLLDAAGSTQFSTLEPEHFMMAQGILVTFSIFESSSFYSVKKWLRQAYSNTQKDVEILLIGHNFQAQEIQKLREVSLEAATMVASTYNVPYVEISAKTGEGVPEVFMGLARKIVLKASKQFRQKKSEIRKCKVAMLLALNARTGGASPLRFLPKFVLMEIFLWVPWELVSP